ncbi:MAG: hypothetical protein FIA91_11365 [Geobacter sp.]|nr:hypothetical protein [Geobacter sp.]
MKLRNILIYLLTVVTLSVCPAYAVDLTISPLGDGRFTVFGAGMKDTAGIHLVIEYDTTILSGPSILNGSMLSGTSAMMSANTNAPGSINVAIIHLAGFNGSGQLLAINFSGRKGVGGITTFKRIGVIDSKSTSQPVTTAVIPETQQDNATRQPDSGGYLPDRQATTQTATQTGAATSGATTTTPAAPSIGGISLPTDNMQPDAQKSQEQQTSPPAEQNRQTPQAAPRAEEPRQTEAKPRKTEELKRIGYVSVLDRFKAYKGDRNPHILAGLFSKAIDSAITQEPLIAAADGTATVKLKVLLEQKEDDSAPNFAASEAKTVSLKSDEATGRWIVELQPSKGALTASLSILAGSRLLDIPLVTVPLVKSLNFSDKEMAAFTKDYGSEKPLFDLNNDGKHDYIDDYIYAGNLLLAGKKPGAAK